jgi:hypothetical protein
VAVGVVQSRGPRRAARWESLAAWVGAAPSRRAGGPVRRQSKAKAKVKAGRAVQCAAAAAPGFLNES